MTIDAGAILRELGDAVRARVDRIDAFDEIGSTNTWLLDQPAPAPGRIRAAIAAHQTSGRGQQGRSWLSPPSGSLALSLACTFARLPGSFSCLTLAGGTAVAGRLLRLGAEGVALKWPNDVMLHDRKLGGILTETRGGGRAVVTGVGLNVDVPNAVRYGPAAKWKSGIADLAESLEKLPSRPALAAAVIEALVDAYIRFEGEGFAAFEAAWRELDWLAGKPVTVAVPHGEVSGIAEGVDADGALLVSVNGRTERVVSGSVLAAGRSVAPA